MSSLVDEGLPLEESVPVLGSSQSPGENSDIRNEHLSMIQTGLTRYVQDDSEIALDEIGAVTEIKPLYEGRANYCTCCKVWDDEKPFDHDNAELRELEEKKRQRYAILRRQTRHGRGTWKTHSLVINSKTIRERLVTVFSDYPSVDPHAVELSFTPPFLPFVHRWEQLMQLRKEEKDELALEHLTLLIDTLGPETELSFRSLQNIENTGYVAFEDLELVYVLGETIVQISADIIAAGVLRDVSLKPKSGESVYVFSVDVVDWDGAKFGVKEELWYLEEYKGSRRLTELEILPLDKLPEPSQTKERLIAQGRKFESLRGYHFCTYVGNAKVLVDTSNYPYAPKVQRYTPIGERVVVDTDTYHALQGTVPGKLRPLEDLRQQPGAKKPVHNDPMLDPILMDPYQPPIPTGTATALINERFSAAVSAFRDPNIVHESLPTLSDEQCLLAVGWVKGFALHSKLSCEFHTTHISDIEWNTTALQNLVLDEGEKRLLTAMISSESEHNAASFDDFVDGKGRGIIILLSGPPGVGKTLTAESVAEHLKRPLYRMGAADLGSTITTVEARLSDTLLRCAAWNAVLLIDEADVFLESRSPDSLERNELISIFLRLLEYYTGILILTTNRVSSLDTAFESRIDISLNYAELSSSARVQVLSNFLKTLPQDSVKVSQEDIAELMAKPMNGRQIKSAVKTARILAESEGAKLAKVHLLLVLGLREKAKTLMGAADEEA